LETFEIYPTRTMTQSLPDALCFLLDEFETFDSDLTKFTWRKGDTHDIYFNRVKALLSYIIQRYHINIRLHSPKYDDNCYDFGHDCSTTIDLYDLGGGCFVPLQTRTASPSSACRSSLTDELTTAGLFSTSSSTRATKRQKPQDSIADTEQSSASSMPAPALLMPDATEIAHLFQPPKAMGSSPSATLTSSSTPSSRPVGMFPPPRATGQSLRIGLDAVLAPPVNPPFLVPCFSYLPYFR
jgi:hypothetical protein